MKKLSFILLSISFSFIAFPQSFPGFRTGTYTGVYGTLFNPAAVAQNNFKWDVNLVGANGEFGNSNAKFNFNNLKKILDGNSDLSQLGNTYETISAFAGADIAGPSFMISKNKWGIALTTRARAMVNITDMDGNVLNSIDNISRRGSPFVLNSAGNQKITVNGWSEFGLSFGKVLHDNENSLLKFGITGKYLAGAANTWLQVKDLRGTLDRDVSSNYFITDAGGSVSTGYSGFDVNNFTADDLLKTKGTGFGGDIGFLFESKSKKDSSNKKSFETPYRLRIGISLTDVGLIKYDAADFADYTIGITSPQRWYPSDLDGKSLKEIKQYFDGSPYFTNNSTATSLKYNVKTPMALNVNADIAMNKNFYTDISAHINLNDKKDGYSSFTYTAFSVTPRYETPHFGFYFPFSYNTLSNFNAGISLRLGPLFVGSGSLFTVLMDNSKQADVHVGLRFGALADKKKKEREKKKKKKEEENEPETKKDSDHDGIPDAEDKCPDVFGVLRYNGCPVPDTDKDGINDEEDKCKDVPGTAKYNGCPVPDTDKDGVDDEHDKCPQLPGKPENNGCPEVKKEITQKANYAARNIYFKSAKYDLLPASYKGLNEVAAVLKANPDLKLTVEGHTDATGIADKNKILSEQRALAVKEYLVLKGGVDPDRISFVGYGQEKPIADNTTREGKARNRRVELKIHY